MTVVFTALIIVSTIMLIIINPDAVMQSLINGANDSVVFGIKLFCIYALWLSVLNLWCEIRFDTFLAKKLKFILKKLFPKENEICYNYLSVNLSANMLGMGSAGTPAGIKAVENMNRRKNKIMLVVINSSSIQIIPTTILAMRSTLNATADIILPSLISTIFSTALGIILVEIFVKDNE